MARSTHLRRWQLEPLAVDDGARPRLLGLATGHGTPLFVCVLVPHFLALFIEAEARPRDVAAPVTLLPYGTWHRSCATPGGRPSSSVSTRPTSRRLNRRHECCQHTRQCELPSTQRPSMVTLGARARHAYTKFSTIDSSTILVYMHSLAYDCIVL